MKRNVLGTCACGVLLALVVVASAQQPSAPRTYPATTPPAASRQAQHEYLIRLQSASQDPERKVNSHVEQWKAAEDDDARGKAEGELRAALKESFEFRLRRHEEQIHELEDRVKRLREQLDQRREKQDEIVDFRLQQLLREAQGLGWGTEPATRLPGLGRALGVDLRQAVPYAVPPSAAPAARRR